MSWVIMMVVRPSSGVQRTIVVAERVTRYRVEGTERLIHQDDARLCGECSRYADPLALATGKFMRKAIAVLARGRVAPDRSTHRPERQFRILASRAGGA